MLKVKIKPERENFKQPIKGTEEAACYDCYCAHIEEKEDGLVICYLGFSQEIPKGWKAIIDPRSSIRNTGWVMANSRGTVDSDFRSEIQASFRPLPVVKSEITPRGGVFHKSSSIVLNDFPYKVGDRVCQISWEKVNEVEFEIVDTLSESNRKGGHGHTGLK
jgi:dUTPase